MHTGLHTCVCMQVWYVLFLAQCLKNSSEDKQSQKERRQQLFFQLMEQHEILPHLPHQPVPHREMRGQRRKGGGDGGGDTLPNDLKLLVPCPTLTWPFSLLQVSALIF